MQQGQGPRPCFAHPGRSGGPGPRLIPRGAVRGFSRSQSKNTPQPRPQCRYQTRPTNHRRRQPHQPTQPRTNLEEKVICGIPQIKKPPWLRWLSLFIFRAEYNGSDGRDRLLSYRSSSFCLVTISLSRTSTSVSKYLYAFSSPDSNALKPLKYSAKS
jgi:hypothetical protein